MKISNNNNQWWWYYFFYLLEYFFKWWQKVRYANGTFFLLAKDLFEWMNVNEISDWQVVTLTNWRQHLLLFDNIIVSLRGRLLLIIDCINQLLFIFSSLFIIVAIKWDNWDRRTDDKLPIFYYKKINFLIYYYSWFCVLQRDLIFFVCLSLSHLTYTFLLDSDD